jgi:DNA-binding MarR family transcriptional regulator
MNRDREATAQMSMEQLREVVGCTCLRMRRSARKLTQLYDHALEPCGLTVNQFGLLAYLQGASLSPAGGLSIGALADRLGMDPTTLNRALKPLEAKGLVETAADPTDGRVRQIRITGRGQSATSSAFPLWREAQAKVEAALGDSAKALNDLLDFSAASLSG